MVNVVCILSVCVWHVFEGPGALQPTYFSRMCGSTCGSKEGRQPVRDCITKCNQVPTHNSRVVCRPKSTYPQFRYDEQLSCSSKKSQPIRSNTTEQPLVDIQQTPAVPHKQQRQTAAAAHEFGPPSCGRVRFARGC